MRAMNSTSMLLYAALLTVAAVRTSSASLPELRARGAGPSMRGRFAAFASGFSHGRPLALTGSTRSLCSRTASLSTSGAARPLRARVSTGAFLQPGFTDAPSRAGARASLRMAGQDAGEHEDYEDDAEEVVVRDPDSGKTIECYVDQQVKIDGASYYIVYPCDTPVVIAYVDREAEEEELIPVAEEDVPRIFAGAYKACSDMDAELVDSAIVLTLQGYEEDLDDDEEELGDAAEDEELVRVITSYEENGVEYLITEPLEPVLIITKEDTATAKTGSDRQALMCLPESELIGVMPQVEKLLEARYEGDD